MNCKQAQTIPITDYLAWRWHFPVYCHSSGNEYSYHSPVREGADNSPSFDVNIQKNLWNDFAWTGSYSTGGDIVKLVCDLEWISVSGALEILGSSGLYTWQKHYIPPTVTVRQYNVLRKSSKKSVHKSYSIDNEFGTLDEQKSGLIIDNIGEITNPILKQYLIYRCLNLSISTKHSLQEINYHNAADPDKKYFALARVNDLGGYEINRRGMYKNFKGCIWPKSISSHINPESDSLAIFESRLDFDAYLIKFKIENFQSSYIILNGASLVDQAVEKILSQGNNLSKIHVFRHRDKAGKNVFHKIVMSKWIRNIKIIDQSHLYYGYNDFNEMLMLTTVASQKNT